MEHLSTYMIHEDDRGAFFGITHKYTWGEINFIETKKNVIRGGHYHKYTKELFYILEGEIAITVNHLVTKETHSFIAKKGMIFVIDPYEVHTFETKIDSKWINMLSHKMDDRNPDIYKAD